MQKKNKQQTEQNQTSPVPKQTSPVPKQISPVPKQTSPVPKQSGPVPKQSSPVPKQSGPVPKQSAPVQKSEDQIPILKSEDQIPILKSEDQSSVLWDPPAGTRDFFPENMVYREWLFNTWKSVSQSFGFQMYDGPIVENLILYTRKGGDDIEKEMYAFKLGNNTYTLRPEMTPTAARMICKSYSKSVGPSKWFSIPQCWRYEDTSRGRKREHYQWNVDIFGAQPVKSEVEILLVLCTFFNKVKLTPDDVTIKISNRQILQKILDGFNVPNGKFERACNIIDKSNKITREELSQMLKDEINLTDDNVQTIFDLIACQNIEGLKKFLGDEDPTIKELQQIFQMCQDVGIGNWICFDASIVRGLSYYTDLCLEGFCKHPDLKRAICGGGRYDNLIDKTYGYKEKVPAFGIGLGDVTILDTLQELKRLPELNLYVDYYVIPYNDEFYSQSLKVCNQIRQKNESKIVSIHMLGGKIGKAFDYARRMNAKFAILVAPTEWKENKIKIKNMMLDRDNENKEKTIILDDFINSI